MSQSRQYKILIVDDNPGIRSFLKPALEEEGYICLTAGDYDEAISSTEIESPDVIVLDIDFGPYSERNGLDVCSNLRANGIRTPVIFLTRRDRIQHADEMARALSMPDSEYMNIREELLEPARGGHAKTDVAELVARIKAILRQPMSTLVFDDYLKIDLDKDEVSVKSGDNWESIRLSPQETTVLKYLVERRGQFTRANYLANAVGTNPHTLETCISKLRQKIQPIPDGTGYIVTRRGKGYSFDPKGGI